MCLLGKKGRSSPSLLIISLTFELYCIFVKICWHSLIMSDNFCAQNELIENINR